MKNIINQNKIIFGTIAGILGFLVLMFTVSYFTKDYLKCKEACRKHTTLCDSLIIIIDSLNWKIKTMSHLSSNNRISKISDDSLFGVADTAFIRGDFHTSLNLFKKLLSKSITKSFLRHIKPKLRSNYYNWEESNNISLVFGNSNTFKKSLTPFSLMSYCEGLLTEALLMFPVLDFDYSDGISWFKYLGKNNYEKKLSLLYHYMISYYYSSLQSQIDIIAESFSQGDVSNYLREDSTNFCYDLFQNTSFNMSIYSAKSRLFILNFWIIRNAIMTNCSSLILNEVLLLFDYYAYLFLSDELMKNDITAKIIDEGNEIAGIHLLKKIIFFNKLKQRLEYNNLLKNKKIYLEKL